MLFLITWVTLLLYNRFIFHTFIVANFVDISLILVGQPCWSSFFHRFVILFYWETPPPKTIENLYLKFFAFPEKGLTFLATFLGNDVAQIFEQQ